MLKCQPTSILLVLTILFASQSIVRAIETESVLSLRRSIPLQVAQNPIPRRIALIIGNANYQSTGKLRNPRNDAQDMAATLKTLGFDVQLLTDATLRQMDDALNRFSQQLNAGGVGVFYYAGHGLQFEGENYLIPIDAKLERELDMRYETMPVGKVLNVMESANNNTNILILDACRNNPFKRKWASSARDLPSDGLAPIQAVKGSYIAYATAPGKIAFDGDGKNGTFTANLLRHIQTPNLSVEGLFKRVRQGVAETTNNRQIPWDSSSLVGDFSFNPQSQSAQNSLATMAKTLTAQPTPSSSVTKTITVQPTSPSSVTHTLQSQNANPASPVAQQTVPTQASGIRTAFAGVPRLIQTVATNTSARAIGATYYFTLEIPATAGVGLQSVKIQLTEGADQDLEFDLKRSYVFEGESYRKRNPRLPLQDAQFDAKSQTVTLTFAAPVPPGKTITIGLQPYRNPAIGGAYLFDVLVYPVGENAKPQSIGYGQLMFYMTGF